MSPLSWIIRNLRLVLVLLTFQAEFISGEMFKRMWLGGTITALKTTNSPQTLLECLALCLIETGCAFVRYNKLAGPECDIIDPTTLLPAGPDEAGEFLFAMKGYIRKCTMINLKF